MLLLVGVEKTDKRGSGKNAFGVLNKKSHHMKCR